MKFNHKKKEKEHSEKENLEKTLEEKEKAIKKEQYTALAMLVTGLLMMIAGLMFIFKVYSVYKPMESGALYRGMKARDSSPEELENDSLEETQKLMNEIENIYNEVYINDIEREEIDESVLNALVKAYGDKYAAYKDPEETIMKYNQVGSTITGIGVYMREETDETSDEYGLYLLDVYDNSPADKAGLEKGDKITHINGKRLDETKYNFDEATKDMKGHEGETVKITFKDASDNGQEKIVRIKRKNTKTYTVRYRKLTDNVGYIKMTQFEYDTNKDLKKAIKELQKQGISKYIFDLRDNSGGLKATVVDILDYLLPEGLIMREVDNQGNEVEVNYSDDKHIEFESVTITNGYTASAAEVFTKCLRDYDKTTIIGETTFGKGTVCTTFDLSNGGSVAVSTGKYFTKSGEDVEKNGIVPDILMKLSKEKEKIQYKLEPEQDDLIQKAVEVLEKQ